MAAVFRVARSSVPAFGQARSVVVASQGVGPPENQADSALSNDAIKLAKDQSWKEQDKNFQMITFKNLDDRSIYRLMCGAIVPRPIAFVSTISPDGIKNLAPMSFFMPVTKSPPTLAWSQTRKQGGAKKDTLANIEATKHFVVHHVSASIFQQMYKASTEFAPDEDEFDLIDGVTPIPSRCGPAMRIKESPVHMECELLDTKEIGDPETGGSTIVIGKIICMHVREDVLIEESSTSKRDGKVKTTHRVDLKPSAMQTISRLGGLAYGSPGFVEVGPEWNESHWD